MQSIYRQLDPDGGHIRLLDIQPSRSKSLPVSCTLNSTRLNQGPNYEALSYTWGRPDSKKSILLNGTPFETFENLEAALRRLRHSTKSRTFWIDALCINQADEREKSEQVSQMDEIYKNATQVVVWLGEPDDGNRSIMRSLKKSPKMSSLAGLENWRTYRAHGLTRGLRGTWGAMQSGELDFSVLGLDHDVGQTAQLLDRPWWRRVWIVQEVVLARKLVILCGSDELPWEKIGLKLGSDGNYGALNFKPYNVQEGIVAANSYRFPRAEYDLLNSMQSARCSGALTSSFYDLLYRFRRFNCSRPEDRIFAFLGLVTKEQSAGIRVDYSAPVSQIYLNAAQSLIASHKHLLILNCRREAYQDDLLYQQTRLYNLRDQGRFIDPNCTVIDGPNKKPRKGWIRLPDGWERIVDDKTTSFQNHNTDTRQSKSPLDGNIPVSSQKAHQFQRLGSSWRKDWDNLGRVGFSYQQNQANPQPKPNRIDLPSWVPNWDTYSVRDPEPLPTLNTTEQLYWASGKNQKACLVAGTDLNLGVLAGKGIIFSTINYLGSAWCPDVQSLPISRSGIDILQAWEEMVSRVEHDPYREQGGMEEAFWRTHIADYVGHKAANEEDKVFFEAWCDRVGWTREAYNAEENEVMRELPKFGGYMQKIMSWEDVALNSMAAHVVEVLETSSKTKDMHISPPTARDIHNAGEVSVKDWELVIKRYREFRERIYRASVNRAMFVTEKGYIGLAPWNARKGDVICVLLGGCTPFIIRPVSGRKHFTLVGEAYVYGIMGGEVIKDGTGSLQLKDIEIV